MNALQPNNLYLVSGTVIQNDYEGDQCEFEHTSLVLADSHQEACDKFDDYWVRKSFKYSVDYYTIGPKAESVIV